MTDTAGTPNRQNMKVVHVILMHKNPDQVVRMIKRLWHPDAFFCIHIDSKSKTISGAEFAGIENVHLLTPRLRVDWGCFNTVQAMLDCMRAVLDSGLAFNYVNFLSGQDYPIKPAEDFFAYLKQNPGGEYIGNWAYDDVYEDFIRVRKYYFNAYSFPGKTLLQRSVNKALPDRRFPNDFNIRKGQQWFALTKEAAAYVLDFVEANPRFARFFNWVHIPDEFFFQTILYNSPFRSAIRNESLHFTDWSEKKKHPRLLGRNDLDALLSSPLFFARKFDATEDASILDALDERIFTREPCTR